MSNTGTLTVVILASLLWVAGVYGRSGPDVRPLGGKGRIAEGWRHEKDRCDSATHVCGCSAAETHSPPDDPATVITWVRIQGGEFDMGRSDGQPDQRPVHSVSLSSFDMGRTEVTVGQYMLCVAAGACTKPHWDDGTCLVADGIGWQKGPSLPKSFRDSDQPVVCVDWTQARAFASWVGGRLPSEAEWEFAARSRGKTVEYPWGDERAGCDRAIIDETGEEAGCGRDTVWPVCSRPSGNTEQGLCDMLGNAAEWCSDWYGNPYSSSSPVRNPTGPPSGSHRVLRGSSWLDSILIGARYRDGNLPESASYTYGFRVARSQVE